MVVHDGRVTARTVDPMAYAIDSDTYRSGDHQWLDELGERSVFVGRPHNRMGVRPVAEANWLVVDDHYGRETKLKARLVTEAKPEVVAFSEGSGPAGDEAASLVGRWLDAYHPDSDALADRGSEEALVAASLKTQEDLCVMESDRDGRWRFSAGVVCFPTYWRLADKIGLGQAEVHGPVPDYQDHLEKKVSTFFDRLGPGQIMGRRNWGISAYPLLFLPDLAKVVPPDEFDPAKMWLRSERQTLRRLPSSGGILFTIKVQMAPLVEVAHRPELAARIVAAVGAWPNELRTGQAGSRPWFDHAINWLDCSGGERR